MENAISLVNVNKDYAGRRILHQFSMHVRKGAIHGFLGPNGAGKTTTLKILNQLLQLDSGDCHLSGVVGFLPEEAPLYKDMLVRDYLMFCYEIKTLNQLTKMEILEKVEDVINRCGLNHFEKRLIRHLSKGQKQKVGIAQAIVADADIIILDEPMVGLDPIALIELRQLLKSLVPEKTILLSSHQLHEVELLCDEVTFIKDGRAIASGTLAQVQAQFSQWNRRKWIARVGDFSEQFKQELIDNKMISSLEYKTIINDPWAKFELEIFLANTENNGFNLSRFLAQEKI